MSMEEGGSSPEAGGEGAKATEQAVQEWLVANLAERLQLNPTEIDVKTPFPQFGLGSQEGAALQGDLERWLGRELSPTLIWDYPSIEQVARHVTER